MPYVLRHPWNPNSRQLLWVSPQTEWERKNGPGVKLLPNRRPPPRFQTDPIVRAIVARVRERLRGGQHPTTSEIRALAEAASAALCEHGNGLVRAEAARILSGLARHQERMRLDHSREAGMDRRHREKLELLARKRGVEALLGPPPGGDNQVVPAAARLRLPEGG